MTCIKYTLAALFLVLAGCATFRDGPNQPIAQWPPESTGGKKTIAIKFDYKHFFNDQELCKCCPAPNAQKCCGPVQIPDPMINSVLRAYRTSGLFSFVRDDSETSNADIRAQVNITRKESGSTASAFITGLTVGVIPGYFQEKFIFNTTFVDPAGTTLGSYENSESSITWASLLLFPFLPYKSQGKVYSDMVFDLNRQTILEAHGKGIF